MAKEVISGIVEKIENIDEFISLVTLTRVFDEPWVQKRIPVYMPLRHEFKGKLVDVISETDDIGNYRQTVVCTEEKKSVKMSENHVLMLQIMYEKYMKGKNE